jgi:hypothetical protein
MAKRAKAANNPLFIPMKISGHSKNDDRKQDQHLDGTHRERKMPQPVDSPHCLYSFQMKGGDYLNRIEKYIGWTITAANRSGRSEKKSTHYFSISFNFEKIKPFREYRYRIGCLPVSRVVIFPPFCAYPAAFSA